MLYSCTLTYFITLLRQKQAARCFMSDEKMLLSHISIFLRFFYLFVSAFRVSTQSNNLLFIVSKKYPTILIDIEPRFFKTKVVHLS